MSLEERCLACINSTENDLIMVSDEMSQKIFNTCCAYVKDAININFWITNFNKHNNKLWFCKKCVDYSLNINKLVGQRIKLKNDIVNFTNSFSESISKSRCQTIANVNLQQNIQITNFPATHSEKLTLNVTPQLNVQSQLALNVAEENSASNNYETLNNDLLLVHRHAIHTDEVKVENNEEIVLGKDDEGLFTNLLNEDSDGNGISDNIVLTDLNHETADRLRNPDLEIPCEVFTNECNVMAESKQEIPNCQALVLDSVRMPNIVIERLPVEVAGPRIIVGKPSRDIRGKHFAADVEAKTSSTISNSFGDRKKSEIRVKRRKPSIQTCKYCSKQLSSRYALKHHIRIHTDERLYECRVCKSRFLWKKTFTRHCRLHTQEKPHKCSQCHRSFDQSSKLKLHEGVHSEKHQLECAVCKYRFVTASSLKRHSRIHSGEKPHKCTQCKKSFTQAGELKIHERIHTGAKPYKCSECERTFRCSSQLSYHKKSAHGIIKNH